MGLVRAREGSGRGDAADLDGIRPLKSMCLSSKALTATDNAGDVGRLPAAPESRDCDCLKLVDDSELATVRP
jgi:hypothetical protein